MEILQKIITAQSKLYEMGLCSTFEVQRYSSGIGYQSYISTSNEGSPSHVKHDSLDKVLERFELFILDNKAEVIKHHEDSIKRHEQYISDAKMCIENIKNTPTP